MGQDKTSQVREALRSWIGLDDEERRLRGSLKAMKEQKAAISATILEFMRDNKVDNFALEGNGIGNISRSVRTSRPALRRNELRTRLLMTFADEPQKVAEFLRSIEGIQQGEDNMSAGGTQKELLVRHIPRTKTTLSMST